MTCPTLCDSRLEILRGPTPGNAKTFTNVFQGSRTGRRTGRAWLQGGDETSNLRIELRGGGGDVLSVPWAGGTGGYLRLSTTGFPVPSDCTSIYVQNQAGPGSTPLNVIIEVKPCRM